MRILTHAVVLCRSSLIRLRSQHRLQQLQNKPVTVPPGAPAAMADTSKLLALIEGLTASAPSSQAAGGAAAAVAQPAVSLHAPASAAGRLSSASSNPAAAASKVSSAGGKGAAAAAAPTMSKAEQVNSTVWKCVDFAASHSMSASASAICFVRCNGSALGLCTSPDFVLLLSNCCFEMPPQQQDVRAAMALLSAMPTVNLQLWAQLSRAAGWHGLWLLARDCATAAVGALPAGKRDLAAVAAASDVPEVGAQGWYWLAVAEMQQGQVRVGCCTGVVAGAEAHAVGGVALSRQVSISTSSGVSTQQLVTSTTTVVCRCGLHFF